MNNKSLYQIILIISLICLIFSVVIYFEKAQYASGHGGICSAITGSNGCEIVQTSSYGKMFGISNSLYGIVGFMILGIFSLISIKKNNKIINYLTIAGGIIAGAIALLLLYIQAFVLHTYCIFCLMIDISSLILLGLAIYLLIKINSRHSRHK